MAGNVYRQLATSPGAARPVAGRPGDATTAATPALAFPAEAAGAVIDGEAPDQFQIVQGPATDASLTLMDDNALESGLFAAGALTLADTTALAGATDILAGTTLAVSGDTSDQSNVEVNGPGASFTTSGALTQALATTGVGGDVFVVDGATLQAGSWTVAGTVFIDGLSSASVGAGTATLGEVSVAAGATLTLESFGAVQDGVADAGAVVVQEYDSSFGGERIEGPLAGAGTLTVLNGGSLSVSGAVSGLSSITIADASGALSGGSATLLSVSGTGAISVGAYGSLGVAGVLQNTGAISFGVHASGSFGAVTAPGRITVGASAGVTFAGALTGAAGMTIATGATVRIESMLSGLSGIALASGATLDFVNAILTTGTDVNVPISLAGSDTLGVQAGVAVDGAVSGFDVTDAILFSSNGVEAGGRIVTDATLSGSDLLSLTIDGGQTVSIQLAGSYAGQRFLTAGVGEILPDGDTVAGLAVSSAALPAGGLVAGAAGASFQLLTGTGSGAGLSFTGNNAVVGTASTDTLAVSGAAAGTLEALLIEAGGSVSATGPADVQSAVEVDGAGALLSAGGALTLGGGIGVAELASVNGGRVRLGGLDVTGYSGTVSPGIYSAVILVDPAGAIEVGSAGGAVAGALTVDAGQTVTSRTLNVLVVANVVDSGTIEVAAPANPSTFISSLEIDGGVTGAGVLRVDNGTHLSVTGSVTGVGGIVDGQSSQLTIDGNLMITAALATGAGSTVSVGGALDVTSLSTGDSSTFSVGAMSSGLSSLTTGASSTFDLEGPASGLGPISIGDMATANFFKDLSGSGAMQVGAGAAVSIYGTVSGLPQITLGDAAALSLFGADDAVGVTFLGSNDLTVGQLAPVTGVLTGLDGTDLLVSQSGLPAIDGGAIVTAATYAATGAGIGTLTLTDDGAVQNTLTLAGAYTANEFLTNVVFVNGSGATDIALAGPTQTGLSGPTVTGGTGFVFDVLAGSGSSADALTFLDNVALEGSFTAPGVTVGGADDVNAVPALDIQAGASLASTTSAMILTGAEVDGTGASLTAQSLTLGGADRNSELYVVNGGTVQTGALTLTSLDTPLAAASDTTLYVDAQYPLSSVEVGAAAAIEGSVDIGAGATLTDSAALGRIDAGVIDDGTIDVLAPLSRDLVENSLQIDGVLSGSGVLNVADLQSASLVAETIGLSSITIGAKSSLNANALTDVGMLLTGMSSSVTVTDNVAGAGGITVGADAKLTVDGDLSGVGVLDVGAGAVAIIQGDVSGLSGITLEAGATLELGGNETAVPIVMGADTTLQIQPGASITGAISGFAHGDVIRVFDDANAKIVTTATDSGGALTLADDGATLNTLTLAGSYAGRRFISNVAGTGGYSAVVVSDIPCFAAGTRILTEHGEVAVEDLREGDRVAALDGGTAALMPVRWIGRRRVDLARHAAPERVRPILVRAGAVADGLPRRDLLVSPDHALFIDGALIPARLLADGGGVAQVRGLAAVTYFHVELERHAILLADGMPAESYLASGNRAMFDDGGDVVALHPDFTGLDRAARSCAELLTDPARVEPIWKRIAQRSAAAGRAAEPVTSTRDARPRLRARGRAAGPIVPAAAAGGSQRLVFAVPAGARTARLASRAAAPSETLPWHDDRRRLGLFVRGLTFYGLEGAAPLRLDDPRLSRGWWQAEPVYGETRRWTDGDAAIPVPRGARMLEVELADTGRYPVKTRTRAVQERPAQREEAA